MKFYAHRNAGYAIFVKEAAFFEQQGGLTEEWGKAWWPVFADSVEDARAKAIDQRPMTCKDCPTDKSCRSYATCLREGQEDGQMLDEPGDTVGITRAEYDALLADKRRLDWLGKALSLRVGRISRLMVCDDLSLRAAIDKVMEEE